MRTSRRSVRAAVVASTALLIVAGCSSGDEGTDTGASGSSGSDSGGDAAIVIDGVQPENPLIPGNTNETGGGRVVDALFDGLVTYAPDDAAPSLDLAESIESTDSKVYTIKLKTGNTFHDGTPVNADSFVNAWNWVAYGPNGALNSYFLEKIEGFADLQSEDPDADGPKKAPEPKAKTMTGLKKVDDLTFTVTHTAPFSAFETTLGYPVFSPLPTSFFEATKRSRSPATRTSRAPSPRSRT